MASHPSLPGCTLHPLANPTGSNPKLWMESIFLSLLSSLALHPSGLPVCTSSLHKPCSLIVKTASRLESGGISPLFSAEVPTTLRPGILTVPPLQDPVSLLFCNHTRFSDHPRALACATHLSTAHSLDVYIHGLSPRAGLSGTFPATCMQWYSPHLL